MDAETRYRYEKRIKEIEKKWYHSNKLLNMRDEELSLKEADLKRKTDGLEAICKHMEMVASPDMVKLSGVYRIAKSALNGGSDGR